MYRLLFVFAFVFVCFLFVCLFFVCLFVFCFFFQAEDGIRDRDGWLEFRRVLFRSMLNYFPVFPWSNMSFFYMISLSGTRNQHLFLFTRGGASLALYALWQEAVASTWGFMYHHYALLCMIIIIHIGFAFLFAWVVQLLWFPKMTCCQIQRVSSVLGRSELLGRVGDRFMI